MSDGLGYTKIGKSIDPKKREIDMKTANPSIKLFAICNKDIEDILHIQYNSYRYKGEWFKLSSEQILDIMSEFNFTGVTSIKSKVKKKPLEEFNPFVNTLIVETGRKIIDYSKYMQDKDNYDKNKNIPLTYLERADKVSLYISPIIRKILCNLSGSSLKLLIWIQQSMIYGNDTVKFNSKRFLKESGMSPSTLVIAKKELIFQQIIAEKKDDKKSFWINPAIMFKGSRTKKYPNNILSPIGSNSTSDSKIN